MDDPFEHKTKLVDIIDPKIIYEVKTYGTLVVNNTFSNNYSGKRGTAMLIERISHLEVEDNKFMHNGPVHTYRELDHSPYYKLFLKNVRTLAFYQLSRAQGSCNDEPSWLNRCYKSGNYFDMP